MPAMHPKGQIPHPGNARYVPDRIILQSRFQKTSKHMKQCCKVRTDTIERWNTTKWDKQAYKTTVLNVLNPPPPPPTPHAESFPSRKEAPILKGTKWFLRRFANMKLIELTWRPFTLAFPPSPPFVQGLLLCRYCRVLDRSDYNVTGTLAKN